MKRSFLAYLGGKSLLAQQIIPLIPKHHCYAEAFGGAGWVLFKKPTSEVEVINDINNDLITLYRVVKYHTMEFVRCLRALPPSREEFNRFLQQDPQYLTDITRFVSSAKKISKSLFRKH